MTELENKIYDIVRTIPSGKVMTYGQIALRLGNKNFSRVVGNAMHKNPLPFFELGNFVGFNCENNFNPPDNFVPVPCHRVVNSLGEMGKNFGLGGPMIQAKMLMAEGIDVSLKTLRIKNLACVLVK